jgi:hypothetical protein
MAVLPPVLEPVGKSAQCYHPTDRYRQFTFLLSSVFHFFLAFIVSFLSSLLFVSPALS